MSAISGIAQSSQVAATGWGGQGRDAMRQKVEQAAAQTLGMSASDLTTALKGGASLADLATAKGISRTDLLNSVATAIGQNAPAGAAQFDPAQMANRIIDRKGGGHHHHHGGAGGVSGAAAASSADAAGQALAALGSSQDPDGDGDVDGASGDGSSGTDFASLIQKLRTAPSEVQSSFASIGVDTTA